MHILANWLLCRFENCYVHIWLPLFHIWLLSLHIWLMVTIIAYLIIVPVESEFLLRFLIVLEMTFYDFLSLPTFSQLSS